VKKAIGKAKAIVGDNQTLFGLSNIVCIVKLNELWGWRGHKYQLVPSKSGGRVEKENNFCFMETLSLSMG